MMGEVPQLPEEHIGYAQLVWAMHGIVISVPSRLSGHQAVVVLIMLTIPIAVSAQYYEVVVN